MSEIALVCTETTSSVLRLDLQPIGLAFLRKLRVAKTIMPPRDARPATPVSCYEWTRAPRSTEVC
jgi:hypothetical protein